MSEHKFSDRHSPTITRVSAITIYAIAMGYLESAVVVYLRQSVFGNSAQVFPVQFLQPQLARVEFAREAATIIMLSAIGILAGKNRLQRLMFFIFAFSIWDIFYYVFLKLITGWPASFTDFDVLFLIPVMWIGPVLCPILISTLLTFSSLFLVFSTENSVGPRIGAGNILLFLLGSLIVFYSFTENIFRILVENGPKGLESYTPESFKWLIFSIGFLAMSISAVKTIADRRHKRTSQDGTDQQRKVIHEAHE